MAGERFGRAVGAAVVGAVSLGLLGAFTGCNTDILGGYLWNTPVWRFTLIGAVNGVAFGLLLARPGIRNDPAGRQARAASARRALGFGLAWLSSAVWACVGARVATTTRLPEPPEPTVVRAALPVNRPDQETRLAFAPNRSGEATVYLTFPTDPDVGQASVLAERRRVYLLWAVTAGRSGQVGPRDWRRADANGEPIYNTDFVSVGSFPAVVGQTYDVRVRLRSASAALRGKTPTLVVEGARRYRYENYVTAAILSFAGILGMAVAASCLGVAFARWRRIDRRLT
jgi:hypothetical protein